MEYLQREFQTIGFKGSFSIGSIDFQHILICFDLEEDFHRCWLKGLWTFDAHRMRVLKWITDFNPSHENSIVQVWISLEGLPIHRFNKDYFWKLASIIGTPLQIDIPTLNMSRPSVAHICVEIDLLKEHPIPIRIGVEGNSYFQSIFYENMPQYCVDCKKIGHDRLSSRHNTTVASQKMESRHPTKHLLEQPDLVKQPVSSPIVASTPNQEKELLAQPSSMQKASQQSLPTPTAKSAMDLLLKPTAIYEEPSTTVDRTVFQSGNIITAAIIVATSIDALLRPEAAIAPIATALDKPLSCALETNLRPAKTLKRSTSGLTMAEKISIPVDIPDSPPFLQDAPSGEAAVGIELEDTLCNQPDSPIAIENHHLPSASMAAASKS
ncbi:OLC1v1015617C1 [Oldenlandia corymbosa var. corymbosa]|uniref:OLC1v1015617C1 n=1 Tax=Oldenlandia corymbosa var. corymbosa TaxID=529605 RepID=A0AAV1E5Y4_OLDCO|nr:OLC1v1015617C1 [Oldenlandia corymbosa var. corymbosa]